MSSVPPPRGSGAASTKDAALPDFALAVDGPLFNVCFRRIEHAGLRAMLLAALGWVPLALLSLRGGPGGGLPFLYDIEAHLRFLAVVPLLIVAELIAEPPLLKAVHQFFNRNLVPVAQRPRFEAAVAEALRTGRSWRVEVGILLFVATAGHWIWRSRVALASATWYAYPLNSQIHLTPAGIWYAYFGVPLCQFLLLRWYVRLFVWYRFLWRTTRLDLRLLATHPDGTGGLGFLSYTSLAFAPILLSQGTLLAGTLANRVLYEGQTLMSFKVDVAGLALFALAMVLAPLLMFSPLLAATKRQGLAAYGTLANRYVQEFDRKWIGGEAPPGERLVGSNDVQSLADMAEAYAVVKGMRLIPFSWRTASQLALITVAPLLPLGLTVIPIEGVIDHLVRVVL